MAGHHEVGGAGTLRLCFVRPRLLSKDQHPRLERKKCSLGRSSRACFLDMCSLQQHASHCYLMHPRRLDVDGPFPSRRSCHRKCCVTSCKPYLQRLSLLRTNVQRCHVTVHRTSLDPVLLASRGQHASKKVVQHRVPGGNICIHAYLISSTKASLPPWKPLEPRLRPMEPESGLPASRWHACPFCVPCASSVSPRLRSG